MRTSASISWTDMNRILFTLAVGLTASGPVPGVSQVLPGPAPSTGGLELPALLDSVALRNPRLQAVTASVEAAASRVSEASTLPDPMFQLGVMNFGLPDFNTDMVNSMAPSVQLMQTVPFPGKLGLRGEIAEASMEMARVGADETWWQIRDEASVRFFELYALDRQIEVEQETLGLLRDLQKVARSLYASGEGRQADVLRADVEVARMDGEIRRMEARRAAVAARINGLLNKPSDRPVASPVLPELPSLVPVQDTLRAWAWESRPALERSRLAVDQADSRVSLAHREVWPNLTLGVSYGRRDMGVGTEHMGSAMIGFSIPIFASRRQMAARDEAEAVKRFTQADLVALRSEVDARIGELLAELDRSRSLMELYTGEILPQASAMMESALASYRVGSVDFMTLLDAHLSVNRYELDLYQLQADYGRAVAGLEAVIGRPLLPTAPSLVTELETR
jgi:cobalt-zinc-cadmium efflux system outer membrane protein